MHVSEHIFILGWLNTHASSLHIIYTYIVSHFCHSASQVACHRPIHYKNWIVSSHRTLLLFETGDG